MFRKKTLSNLTLNISVLFVIVLRDVNLFFLITSHLWPYTYPYIYKCMLFISISYNYGIKNIFQGGFLPVSLHKSILICKHLLIEISLFQVCLDFIQICGLWNLIKILSDKKFDMSEVRLNKPWIIEKYSLLKMSAT